MIVSEDLKKEKEKNIDLLKSKLNLIFKQKEIWFKKKEELKSEINHLVKQIKDIKSKRDKANISLYELKKQRDKYNYQVKLLIKQLKSLNKEKSSTLKKYNIKVDPAKIQEKINDLERKVETEVNFKKEQKLMVEIKKLKKAYDQVEEINVIIQKTSKIEEQFKEARKKANDIHKKIRLLAKDADYAKFMDLSKRITELKKQQEDAFNKFISYKNESSNLSKQLEIPSKEKNQNIKNIIMEKYKYVEEKLKQKKKLTTDDILAYQAKK